MATLSDGFAMPKDTPVYHGNWMFSQLFFRLLSFHLFASTVADNINIKFLGCYLRGNELDLGSDSHIFSPLSPQSCSAFCSGNQNPFFVLLNDVCFCSDFYIPRQMKQYDAMCSINCSGDKSASCGGTPNFISSYLTDNSNVNIDDQFVGCIMRQKNTPDDMEFELAYTNTPSKCAAICNHSAYRFAGVMGTNCICSNRVFSAHKLEYFECNGICVGDSRKTCGGYGRIKMYDLKKPSNNQSSTLWGESGYLNLNSFWNHEIYIPQEPDYEFNYYNNSKLNAFMENGELIIKPTILSEGDFIKKGILDLKGCTKNDTYGICSKKAVFDNMLPPIMSAKLTTKNNLFFRYGQIQLIAKLPAGDWIVSELALVNSDNENNRLVLLTNGNSNLNCNGEDESSNVIRHGLQLDEQYHLNSMMDKAISKNNRSWTDDYHLFELFWTPGNVSFGVDGFNRNFVLPNLLQVLFHTKNYFSMSVSVGGMRNFPDGCFSSSHLKPWENWNPKAMLNFWKDRAHWSSTWNDEKSTLRIKSMKFTPYNLDG